MTTETLGKELSPDVAGRDHSSKPVRRVTATIVGGSGYTGGELLRLLLQHPYVEVGQVTSQRFAGKYVHGVHPNLRGRTTLKFVPPTELERCDVMFSAQPHGSCSASIDRLASCTDRIIDLSADFRLREPELYREWYGEPHAAPDWLARFVYGLPELRRDEIAPARFVSGVGCNATAMNLGLAPLARRGLIRAAVADIKVGSSEAGATPGPSSHHPERSGAVRTYAPAGHRHQAEVQQELGNFELHVTVTAIEMVRGVLCTAHIFPTQPLTERDLWKIYRESYASEPFVRLVNDRQGVYRYPEPKILAGTNFCDIGFAVEPRTGRIVIIGSLDNLMKGAAGTAVQCLNLMQGWPETTALEFAGLHP
jgi:N-acetyl-gamma-glutamyl-phosphate/LysW-gamma-L-alpha-aminoadipyl-6-phosphate reductase